jgi:fructose-bisphosphate aldolase class 1
VARARSIAHSTTSHAVARFFWRVVSSFERARRDAVQHAPSNPRNKVRAALRIAARRAFNAGQPRRKPVRCTARQACPIELHSHNNEEMPPQ